MMRFIFLFFTLALATIVAEEGEYSYTVNFVGIQEERIEKKLRHASKMHQMRDHPPRSESALRRRAEHDIENLLQVMQHYAYYNAVITVSIVRETFPIQVNYIIQKGRQFPLAGVEICPNPFQLSPRDLGLELGKPARPKLIKEGESYLINFLSRSGYPFAKVENLEVFADLNDGDVTVRYNVDMGPYAYFGDVRISGNFSVAPRFFHKKLRFCYGSPYDPCLVQETLEALEYSRLFQSISISHDNELVEGRYLPMEIEVEEAPPRTFGAGLSYSTQLGPGFTSEWRHRNYFHSGEHVGVTLEALEKRQDVNFFYTEPDVWTRDQDLIFRTELQHEKIEAYKERSFSLSALLDRRYTDNFRFSYGLKYTNLFNSSADADPRPGTDILDCKVERSYNLFKLPFHFYWSDVCNLLDPQEGSSFSLKAIPSFQITTPFFDYHTLIGTYARYIPLSDSGRVIIASKTTMGSIVGTSRDNIPPSERFYAGSENNLRGYDYLTVSSVLTTTNSEGKKSVKPIGGKSIFTQSLELRWHATSQIGLVGFYDFGNVYDNSSWNGSVQTFALQADKDDNFKTITGRENLPYLLHSIGFGVRYYTPVGPLRLDVAFPLTQRSGIDRWGQIYFSVGQSF